MDTKELFETLREFSDLKLVFKIDDNKIIEIADFTNDLALEYFEFSNALHDEFHMIFLKGDLELLNRISIILTQAIEVWRGIENSSLETLTFQLEGNPKNKASSNDIKRIAELKIYHLEGLQNKIISLTGKKIHSSLKVSQKKGAKTNILRVLNALYELNLITGTNDFIPNKKDYFKEMGKMLNSDFSNYESSISQSLNNQSLEKNIEIFNDMIEAIKNKHYLGK